MTIVLASGNKYKGEEVRAILHDCPLTADVEVLLLKDIGFTDDIVEDGTTFEENAMIKAKTIAKLGYICIADDSGLEVDALGGAPGIYSARYAGVDGEHGDDQANNRLLLKELADVPLEKRTARYVCAIACAYPDGSCFTVRATCEGRILYEEIGEGGFGYDPLFYVEEYQKTLACVTAEEKHAISHRGKALRLFAERFAKGAN